MTTSILLPFAMDRSVRGILLLLHSACVLYSHRTPRRAMAAANLPQRCPSPRPGPRRPSPESPVGALVLVLLTARTPAGPSVWHGPCQSSSLTPRRADADAVRGRPAGHVGRRDHPPPTSDTARHRSWIGASNTVHASNAAAQLISVARAKPTYVLHAVRTPHLPCHTAVQVCGAVR